VPCIFMSEYAKVQIHVNIQLNMQLHIGHSLNIHEFIRFCMRYVVYIAKLTLFIVDIASSL
jgi:hypothetical protein